MKKIDRLLITSFIPPFGVSFFIALFVLMMQYLWVYIDDIIGKGADFLMVAEFVFYLSISLIPWALPLGVLIASVMVLGSLAERFELSSMKSAGMSLIRIMFPLMVLTFGISVFSYICSNYLIPKANLKFKSRLYDLRKQKPTLSLEQGVFNDDFHGYVIRIGQKDANGRSIKDVMIYENDNNRQVRFSQTTAESGEMFNTKDKQFLVMQLKNGRQYQEPVPITKEGSASTEKYPFVRIKFKEWNKVFDLREFDISRTDENLFKSNQSMLNTSQLMVALDSLTINKVNREKEHLINVSNGFAHFDTNRHNLKEAPIDATKIQDSLKGKYSNQPKWDTIKAYANIFNFVNEIPEIDKKYILSRALTKVRTQIDQSKSSISSLERLYETNVKFIFELHSKFSWAIVCMIFLFIGAPMGAIVRKGGFGYPILVAIIFFMLFIIMTIMSKKMAEAHTLSPVLASWLPCLIMFPIGLFLTNRAMKDSAVLNIDAFEARIKKISQKLFVRNKKNLSLTN